MAADYLDLIRDIQPSGPYNLLGWSFGGLVAHAMATNLQRSGEDVALLALLDSYPREHAQPTNERESAEQMLFAGVADELLRDMLELLQARGSYQRRRSGTITSTPLWARSKTAPA